MNSPSLAPKNGTLIIATFKSVPCPVMAMWCGASEAWCAAIPQVDMYLGELNDWYFENEHFPDECLTGWADARGSFA